MIQTCFSVFQIKTVIFKTKNNINDNHFIHKNYITDQHPE